MSRIYTNAKANFTSFDEFKEVATKTLNEIYGRVRPLDVIDFGYNENEYVAVGYYDGEEMPQEQKAGEPQSGEAAAAEQFARENEDKAKAQAHAEAVEAEQRITAAIIAGEALSPEDQVIAVNLGILLPQAPAALTDEQAAELEAKVKAGLYSYEAAHAAGLQTVDGVPTLEAAKIVRTTPAKEQVADENEAAAESTFTVKEILAATDEAIALAAQHGIDLKLVTGTGKDGNIKKSDVANYIEANKAPAQENANGNGDEQSNA
jgi:hypothetical protein